MLTNFKFPENYKKKKFALVDCNSFYASCEKVFRPDLRNKPVAVLSNNDGIIVARSKEVKEIGIPMGAPFFKVKDLISKYKVHVFSSNYTLYADMSDRVMQILASFAPEIEIYSIDEAFLAFEDLYEKNLTDYARYIKKTVEKWTGIPISVGIGPTKTLAKAANKLAKKIPELDGAFDITDHPQIDEFLEKLKVVDIWGVGRQYSKKLNMCGIYNTRQFRDAPDEWIKKNLTVAGLRTMLELRGQSCIGLESTRKAKKTILRSRSFGKNTGSLMDIQEAVATYASYAGEDLRHEGLAANMVSAFIMTSFFAKSKRYFNKKTIRLSQPTDYTPDIARAARNALEQIYRDGYSYQKAGVVLTGLVPASERQLNLFEKSKADNFKYENNLMQTIDSINAKWGRSTLKTASEGLKKGWKMKRQLVSKRFTTSWDELLRVNI